MKTGKLHRVPLSPEAMVLLEATPPESQGPDTYVFHDGNSRRHLSNMTMSVVLRRMGVDDATVTD